MLKDSQLSTLGCAAAPNLHSPFTSVVMPRRTLRLPCSQRRRPPAADRRAQGHQAQREDRPLKEEAWRRLGHHHRELHQGQRVAEGAEVRHISTAQPTVDQAPMTLLTCRPLGARRQARRQQYRRGGRQGDFRRAQGLSAVYAGVRCYPKSTLGLYVSGRVNPR